MDFPCTSFCCIGVTEIVAATFGEGLLQFGAAFVIPFNIQAHRKLKCLEF